MSIPHIFFLLVVTTRDFGSRFLKTAIHAAVGSYHKVECVRDRLTFFAHVSRVVD